jgi:hypothetical protein
VTSRDHAVQLGFLGACVLALHAVVWTLMCASTVWAQPLPWLGVLAICGAFVAAGFIAILRLRMDSLGAILVLVPLGYAAGRAGILLTYVTYSLDRDIPLWDEALVALDSAVGFHWPSMLAWFNTQPALSGILGYCYNAFLPQQPVLPIALALASRFRQAQVVLLASLIGLVATHAIAFFLPASGAYGFYEISSVLHPDVGLVSGSATVRDHALVRSGALILFDSHRWLGLITFPSYHALLAIVLAWAWWHVPFLRWPGVAVNVGMLVSALPHGSHHLIDVIAGGALALVCISLASKIMARFDVPEPIAAPGFAWVPSKS